MRNLRFIIFGIILALLCGIVPVSADKILIDEVFVDYTYLENIFNNNPSTAGTDILTINSLVIHNVEYIYGVNIESIILQSQANYITNYATLPSSDWSIMTFNTGGISGNLTFGYFKFQTSGGTDYLQIWVEDIEFSTLPTGLSGVKFLDLAPQKPGFTFPKYYSKMSRDYIESDLCISPCAPAGSPHRSKILSNNLLNVLSVEFKNQLIISHDGIQDTISIIRNFNGSSHFSYLSVSPMDDSISIPLYGSDENQIFFYHKSLRPYEVGLYSPLLDKWYGNYTIDIDGVPPTPTPTPTPALTTTYPVKINFRHQHDYSLVTDVYYLIGDLKPSPGYPYGKTLYSGWSDTGTINIELEHRSMDDPNFPQQYRIVGKKYGYYDGEVIVSHLTYPYTFNVIMEDSSVTSTVDTNFIEFRIQERFSDSYINEAILTIYDYESGVEVYNETVTGGIVTVRLNQTDTGYPYPHYKVNVYSEGYADFTEYILALYQDGIMRCRLTKVTTPLDPGNVILHVYTVRLDSNDNVVNVANVRVTVGGIEKVTNSAGYTWFEVPKNSTQMYTAEHPQYAVMSGSVLVEEGERFLHIWMQPPDIGVTPTPTFVTPTPTPDYSTPTGPIDAVYNLFSMLGIPTLFIGFILTALIAIGCMIFAESFAEGTGLYAGILGVLIGAGMGLIPLWIIIAFVFIGGIFYMKIIRGDG